jgi:hypothetical protein
LQGLSHPKYKQGLVSRTSMKPHVVGAADLSLRPPAFLIVPILNRSDYVRLPKGAGGQIRKHVVAPEERNSFRGGHDRRNRNPGMSGGLTFDSMPGTYPLNRA